MTAILPLLRQDHANLERMLKVFEEQLARFEDADSPDYDLMIDILDYCAQFPDKYHHPLEDRVLEMLRRRDAAAADRIGDLDTQHEALAVETRDVLTEFHRVRQDMVVDRPSLAQLGRIFVDAYRRHISMEERSFFPVAEAVLTDADWTGLEDAWLSPLDPVFGDRVVEHYRRLRREVLSAHGATDDD